MKSIRKEVMLVSAAFAGGQSFEQVELRAPSLRGQLRWWLRAMGAGREMESTVFGSVHGGANASSVRLRVLASAPLQVCQAQVLPHKHQAPRPAIAKGTSFEVILTERPLLKSTGPSFEIADLALQAWLLLGAMGFRANRGAGSVWPKDGPRSITQLHAAIQQLRNHAGRFGLWGADSRLGRGTIDLLEVGFADVDEARKCCSDSVHDNDGALGYARGRDRLASPLKVKIVHLPEEGEKPYRILRVALPEDTRNLPAGRGIEALARGDKKLGGKGIVLMN